MQFDAVARTVMAMRDAGRLTPADDALVAAIEGVASLIDAGAQDANMWREYRMMLKQLAEVGAADGGDDDLDELLEAFRGGAPLGNAANVSPDART
jgi:hypothetical protein